MAEACLLAAVRYVELNPVKAKLCTATIDWKWSSVHAHLSAVDDAWVTVTPMLGRISHRRKYLGEL
jgi:putative transposase